MYETDENASNTYKPEEESKKKIISSKVYHAKNGTFRILCVAISEKGNFVNNKRLKMNRGL